MKTEAQSRRSWRETAAGRWWRRTGTRSAGSSATSASTPRSTSRTTRWPSARSHLRSSAATASSCRARTRATPTSSPAASAASAATITPPARVYAQNMAYGIKPPALAEWMINLGEAAEYMFDHNIFQDNLVFVDFCEQMVKETNPAPARQGREDPRPARRSCTASAPSPTSCGPSIRSKGRCTSRRCKWAARPARCAA